MCPKCIAGNPYLQRHPELLVSENNPIHVHSQLPTIYRTSQNCTHADSIANSTSHQFTPSKTKHCNALGAHCTSLYSSTCTIIALHGNKSCLPCLYSDGASLSHPRQFTCTCGQILLPLAMHRRHQQLGNAIAYTKYVITSSNTCIRH